MKSLDLIKILTASLGYVSSNSTWDVDNTHCNHFTGKLDELNRNLKCDEPFNIKLSNNFTLGAHLAVHWYGSGESSTILAAETYESTASPSWIWISKDYGKTFQQLNTSEHFQGYVDFSGEDRESIHIEPKNGIIGSHKSTRIIVIEHGKRHEEDESTIWIVDDLTQSNNHIGYKSWKKVDLQFRITGSDIQIHPEDDKHILAKGKCVSDENCLFVTYDGGENWAFIKDAVHSYSWETQKRDNGDITFDFYYTIDETKKYEHFSDNYVLYRHEKITAKSTAIQTKVYSFGCHGNFLYVSAKYYYPHDKKNVERIMLISTNHGAGLVPVQIPDLDHDRFYAVLDASEDMIFFHVDDKGDTGYGSIYTSDSTGRVFDLSLRRHLYPNFSPSEHRNKITDFYKVDSPDSYGTYITSRVLPEKSNSIETVITFNKGGKWQVISEDNVEKIKGKCRDSICNLQIHNQFSLEKNIIPTSGPKTSKNAPGLILAHANLGDALTDTDIDFYISTNGGKNWHWGLEGKWHYEILDHGGIIIAVSGNEKMVSTVKISFDGGRCWIDHVFTGDISDKIRFTGFITETGGRQSKFSILGWGNFNGTEHHVGNWVLYHVDLSNVFEQKCGRKPINKHVMGSVLAFYEKDESYCGKGENWEIMMDSSVKDKCTIDDFKCGFKFEKDGDECVKMHEARTKMEYDNGKDVQPSNLHYKLSKNIIVEK